MYCGCVSNVVCVSTQITLLEPTVYLEWEQCLPLPHPRKHVQVVEFRGKIYIGSGYGTDDSISCQIYRYVPTSNAWEDPLASHTRCFAMTVFSDSLILIGGVCNDNNFCKKIQALTPNEQEFCFYENEEMPEMNSARAGAVSASLTFNVVVAGGYQKNKSRVTTVEVYDRRYRMWYFAPELPQSCAEMKMAIAHGDQWYLLGGSHQYSKVFTASLQKLITTSVKPLIGENAESNGQESDALENGTESRVWVPIADLQYDFSFVSIFGGSLIALGGEKTKLVGSAYYNQIFVYNNEKRAWLYAADLPIALSKATALTLSNGEMLVIGGRNRTGDQLNTVYKCKLMSSKSCL